MVDIKAEYVDHLGDDLRVVNSARVSFDKESDWENPKHGGNYVCDEKGRPFGGKLKLADEKLIRFLARERHEMPFAHCQVTLRVKAPVPIARQAFKSKVGFVESEESRRYIKSTPEIYVPDEFRAAPVGSIKQGSGNRHSDSDRWRREYEKAVKEAVFLYEDMISAGICPEQARFVLPQGAMVNWIWTGSLLAYARFYKLRADGHAQKEIQELAGQIDAIVRPLFPVSWSALVGETNSEVTISKTD